MMIVALYLELISFVVGCILVRKRWPWHYRLAVVLKGLSFIVEWGSMAWSIITHSSNHWLYNIFIPLACAGYLVLFYRAAPHPFVRRFNGWLLVVLPPLVGVSFFLSPELMFINLISGIGCSVLLLLASCSAFIGLLLGDEDDISFFRQPLFWLAGGMLFYSISNAIYFVTWEMTKKMILTRFIFVEILTAEILLCCCMMACFVCVYSTERDPKVLQPE